MGEYEERLFQQKLKSESEFLRDLLLKESKPKRPKSLIKHKIKTSWGRRKLKKCEAEPLEKDKK